MEGQFADDRTSVLQSSNCSVCGTCREGRCGGAVSSVGVVRAMRCHLRAGFQQCKSFVEMGTVRCCSLQPRALSHVDCAPGAAEDCITSARKLWRARAEPEDGHRAIVVQLVVVPLLPSSQCRLWRVVCWADILLDVISGVESVLLEGCPRTMTGVSQYWFSGHFRQVFSTPMHYPALIL